MFREEAGRLKFLCLANDGIDEHMAFTKEIYLEKDRWQGYIKDCDGGILMECRIDPKLPYTDLSTMIRRQRQAIDEKIRELSNCHIVYTGFDFQKKEAGIPKKIVKVEDIPGLRYNRKVSKTDWKPVLYMITGETGWTPDQWGHSRFSAFNTSTDCHKSKALDCIHALTFKGKSSKKNYLQIFQLNNPW
ncbi:hypothetical protein GH714_036777 [Hevea brasiliensis]|uniref:Uncharacterized protein n=1 Tax=Hevea brasiliensis TaxID=3981 RepID=A0A6A6MSD3_HEVBR|nr:hypothetical protein GH714_036777 [Hevea brasiliensis]